MNKPVFGMVLGGVLGILDGLSAMVSAPETRPVIAGIVVGSTIKGLIVGALIGAFARKVNSLGGVIVFGTVLSALFAFVAQMQHKYYLEIIVPGAIVGLIVGFATQRHVPAVSRA